MGFQTGTDQKRPHKEVDLYIPTFSPHFIMEEDKEYFGVILLGFITIRVLFSYSHCMNLRHGFASN